MKTFIENYTKATAKEKERMIVKSLSYARPHNKVRKQGDGWVIYTVIGNYYVEFSDKKYLLWFSDYKIDKIQDKEHTEHSDYVYVYKDKNSAPVKEVDVKLLLEDAIRFYKLIKD